MPLKFRRQWLDAAPSAVSAPARRSGGSLRSSMSPANPGLRRSRTVTRIWRVTGGTPFPSPITGDDEAIARTSSRSSAASPFRSPRVTMSCIRCGSSTAATCPSPLASNDITRPMMISTPPRSGSGAIGGGAGANGATIEEVAPGGSNGSEKRGSVRNARSVSVFRNATSAAFSDSVKLSGCMRKSRFGCRLKFRL